MKYYSTAPLPLGATAAQTAKNVRALRLALIDAIAAHLDARMAGARSTQAELAALLGISRPRLNRLLAREVALFGLDSLAAIAMRAGLTVRLNAVRPYSRR